MAHDAVGRAGTGMHSHEQAGVAAFLQEARVLGPLLLGDVLAVRVDEVGDQGVERPAFAGAVMVHDDDLRRAGRLAPRTAALISSV